MTYIPLDSVKKYFGNENVTQLKENPIGSFLIQAVRDPIGTFMTENRYYVGTELAYDLDSKTVFNDPFGNQLLRKQGDEIIHFKNDSVLHYPGEVQRYIGGEVAYDESAEVVLNANGSIFRRLPGQVIISDMRDLIFAPDFMNFSTTANGFSNVWDLGIEENLTMKPNIGVSGWALNFNRVNSDVEDPWNASKRIDRKSDRLVSVVVTSELGTFALSESEYTFNENENEQLEITSDLSGRVKGDVTITAHLAILAFHRTGDHRTYFGDEVVQSGQPVIEFKDQVFSVRKTEDGKVITYTDNQQLAESDESLVYYKNASGNIIKHQRGEPIYTLSASGNEVEEVVITSNETLIPQRYTGNEALIYFGGEQAFYRNDDVVLTSVEVTRVDGLKIPGSIDFTNQLFGAGSVIDDSDELKVTLGDGNDSFTIKDTPLTKFNLVTGSGDDQIAVRKIRSETSVDSGSGDDKIYVGSFAGFWDTDKGDRLGYRIDPLVSEAQFINSQGDIHGITKTLKVDSGAGSDLVVVDDTGDSIANTDGNLTSTELTGLGIGTNFSIHYNENGNTEEINVNLGSSNDEFTVESTSATTITRIEGRGGNDRINVKTNSGSTLLYGDSQTNTVTIGTQSVIVNEGNDVFLVGSQTQSEIMLSEDGGVLDSINGLLQIFGGSSLVKSDQLRVYDDGSLVNKTGDL